MSVFSERLVEALRIRHVSAAELARAIDIDEGTISNYKKGKYEPKQRRTEQIADALNINVAWLIGVSDIMEKMISQDANIIPMTGAVPIYGCIPAGVPAFAEQNIEGYMPIMYPHPEEYFCLIVKGDSMVGAGITSGSKVLLHKQSCAENGQIVACRVNGDEATLKRFKQSDDTILLMPENSAYDPIIVSCKQFEEGYAEILGVAKDVVINLQ